MPPIVYHASRGDGLLTGKIDRVDTYEKDGTTYFRIVDYKTGRKDFSYTDLLYGKDLQMLLYLFALQENQKKAGHPMQPAGALYVPGRCDMIRLEPGEDAGEADTERRKQLRRRASSCRTRRSCRRWSIMTASRSTCPCSLKRRPYRRSCHARAAGRARTFRDRPGRSHDRRDPLRQDPAEPRRPRPGGFRLPLVRLFFRLS